MKKTLNTDVLKSVGVFVHYKPRSERIEVGGTYKIWLMQDFDVKFCVTFPDFVGEEIHRKNVRLHVSYLAELPKKTEVATLSISGKNIHISLALPLSMYDHVQRHDQLTLSAGNFVTRLKGKPVKTPVTLASLRSEEIEINYDSAGFTMSKAEYKIFGEQNDEWKPGKIVPFNPAKNPFHSK